MSQVSSRFLCLFFQDFPVWAVQEHNSQLAARTVLLHAGHQIIAASPAARAAGIHAGCHLIRAQSKLPSATFIAHNPAQTSLAWDEILQTLNRYTPQVESVRPGVVMLDPAPLFAVPPTSGEAMGALRLPFGRLLQQWGAHGGLATDRATAEIAAYSSVAGTVRTVRGGQNFSYLNMVPIEVLNKAEVSTDTIERLREFGLTHLGHLRLLSKGQLQELFPEGRLLHRYAVAGTKEADVRAVTSYRVSPTLKARYEFAEPAHEPSEWENALDNLTSEIKTQLHDHSASALSLTVEEEEGRRTAHRLLGEPLTTTSAHKILERVLHAQLLSLVSTQRVGASGIHAIEVKLCGVLAASDTKDKKHTSLKTSKRLQPLEQALHNIQTQFSLALSHLSQRQPAAINDQKYFESEDFRDKRVVKKAV
jgi:protein ImuB